MSQAQVVQFEIVISAYAVSIPRGDSESNTEEKNLSRNCVEEKMSRINLQKFYIAQ